MPRAGWCRECDEWVWVGDDGECQHGHAAGSVSHVHDAEPQLPPESDPPPPPGDREDPAPAARRELPEGFGPVAVLADAPAIADPVGVGPMPQRLERFNWGAFLLPAVWGVVYNVWAIVGLWFVATFSPLFLGLVFGVTRADGSISMPALIGVTVLSDAFLAYVRLWAGGSANKLYWEREAKRLATVPEAVPKFGVGRFEFRQRLWVPWGVLGLLGGLVFTLVSNYRLMKPYGFGAAFVAEALVFTVAELGLAFWLARRMRDEFPAGPPARAEDEPGSGPDAPEDAPPAERRW